MPTGWGLMKGDLEASFAKGGQTLTRTLEADRTYTAPDGTTFALPGRSLLFVRNVGHLMTTPAILLPDGSRRRPRGSSTRIVTSPARAARSRRPPGQGRAASPTAARAAIYIVKPKMHGPDECGVHRTGCSTRWRTCWALAAAHDQGGRDGRGAPHLGQPRCVHRGGEGTGSCSSTPASSTAPATRCIRRCARARCCARAT